MSIKEDLSADLQAAMRERDKARLAVIRSIETEVARARSEPGFSGEVDDDLYLAVIRSYIKKMDKARLEFEAAGERGAGQAAALAYEIEYLSRWLPAALDEDQTRRVVSVAIAELKADDPKMAGRVIGHIMRNGPEGLDGALVSKIVREELGGA